MSLNPKKSTLSYLAMANIEALAGNEGGGDRSSCEVEWASSVKGHVIKLSCSASCAKGQLAQCKQYEESNKILSKAMKISCDPMLYNIMGRNYQALKSYDAAERNFVKAANIVPSRLYPYYLLAKLYDEMKQPEKVCEMSETMKTKEIKIDSPAIDQMRDEINKLCENN